MATKSFHEGLEIRDGKAARALLRAVEKGSHKPINRLDITEEIERGKVYLKNRYSP
mgnify:CR=1 FL=1